MADDGFDLVTFREATEELAEGALAAVAGSAASDETSAGYQSSGAVPSCGSARGCGP